MEDNLLLRDLVGKVNALELRLRSALVCVSNIIWWIDEETNIDLANLGSSACVGWWSCGVVWCRVWSVRLRNRSSIFFTTGYYFFILNVKIFRILLCNVEHDWWHKSINLVRVISFWCCDFCDYLTNLGGKLTADAINQCQIFAPFGRKRR